MPALRPVAADARLTLVEHLGELRSRLFACIAIVIVAFAFTYWQNHRVLEIVNAPLTNAQVTSVDCDRSVDPIRSGECFDRALARALGTLRPLIADGPADSRQERRQRDQALVAVDRAVRMAPDAGDRKPVTLGVAEPFFQTVNVALYAALVLTLPLLLYQLYAFLIPAFTRRERQAIMPLLLGVPLLFYAGVLFGYFMALPRAVEFLQNFNASQFDILVQARDYYKFVLLFLAGTGMVFQVPVVVIAISRLGIVSAAQMRKQRGMVAVAAAVVSAIITPTPDAVTMLLVMVPFLVLFEVSVAIAGVLERRAAARWQVDDDGPVAAPAGAEVPPRGASWSSAGADPAGDPPVADDWVEETWDDDQPDDPPVGEEPDPRLLGDPDGPRRDDATGPPAEPAEPSGWAPEEPGDDWLARADALDDDDPFATGPEPEPDDDADPEPEV